MKTSYSFYDAQLTANYFKLSDMTGFIIQSQRRVVLVFSNSCQSKTNFYHPHDGWTGLWDKVVVIVSVCLHIITGIVHSNYVLQLRRMVRLRHGVKYMNRVQAKKAHEARHSDTTYSTDPTDEVFNTNV